MTRSKHSLMYPACFILERVKEVVELPVLLSVVVQDETSFDSGLWVYMGVWR